MNISGSDILNRYNLLNNAGTQNFNTRDVSSEAVSSGVVGNSPDNILERTPSEKPEPDGGATLKLSGTASAVRSASGQRENATEGFAPVSFSTKSGDDQERKNTQDASGNDQVLSRYRYFVNDVRYEGSEGIVRRIFG